MPVILATQEVEIGRSQFEAILGKKLVRLYLKNQAGNGGASVISAPQEVEVGGTRSTASWAKAPDPI
jgi:hypothetical protein